MRNREQAGGRGPLPHPGITFFPTGNSLECSTIPLQKAPPHKEDLFIEELSFSCPKLLIPETGEKEARNPAQRALLHKEYQPGNNTAELTPGNNNPGITETGLKQAGNPAQKGVLYKDGRKRRREIKDGYSPF